MNSTQGQRRSAFIALIAGLFAVLAGVSSLAQVADREATSEAPASVATDLTQALTVETPEAKDKAPARTAPYGEAEIRRALQYQVSRSAAVNPYYILGPDDEIIINLWGKQNQTFSAVVDNDGFVTLRMDIPRRGAPADRSPSEVRFSVNGLYFKDLKMRVVRELARLSSDIDPQRPESSPILVDVNLGRIRGITITVWGEVQKQGQWTLNTTISSVFNALAAAGGPTPNASLREIVVRRPGNTIDHVDLQQFDLYEMLTRGRFDEALFHLKDGDIVIVPRKRGLTEIKGEVKWPGQYEVKTSETLQSLIMIAGGLTPRADPHKIGVLRGQNPENERFVAVDYTSNPDFIVADGDEIEILAQPLARRLNLVEIKGDGVRQPGKFAYRKGMTFGDLIAQAGGLYDDAVLDNAVLVRTLEDYSLSFSTVNLKQILEGKSEGDTLHLAPMDKLFVYSKYFKQGGDKFVRIEGHVKEPGEFPLASNMTLSDLIFMAGGFGDPDFVKQVYLERGDIVRRASGQEVLIPFHLGRLLGGDKGENHALESGDVVRIYSVKEIEGQKQVTVSGHVKYPGAYRLTQNMRLRDLLFEGGGFDDSDFLKATYLDRADLIRVDARSHARTILPVDLRRVLEGDPAANLALESLDELIVYAFDQFRDQRAVTISGEVRNPNEFPLTENMTLADLLSLANGLTDMADAGNIEIARFPPPDAMTARAAQLITVSLGETDPAAVRLQDRDRVVVRRRAELTSKSTVTVSGWVVRPGPYVLVNRSETLSDVIQRADGFVRGAAPEAAYLLRRAPAGGPRADEDKTGTGADDEDNTGAGADEARAESKARVAIDLPRALDDPHGPYDVPLLDGDEVCVPERNWIVEVRGEALAPGLLQFIEGDRAPDYVARAGGYTINADKRRVVVIYPNGEARKARRGWFFSREIKPGSVIVVPGKDGKYPLMAPLTLPPASKAMVASRPAPEAGVAGRAEQTGPEPERPARPSLQPEVQTAPDRAETTGTLLRIKAAPAGSAP